MILWFHDGYMKYALCILVISLGGVIQNLYETMSNMRTIRKMAKYECQITVKRRVNSKSEHI
jgi:hypothetical protein